MVQCELCGKVVRTTQGLRGHKTFIHGLRANPTKPIVALAYNQPVDEPSSLFKPKSDSISVQGDLPTLTIPLVKS